jgi:hypothetical protein
MRVIDYIDEKNVLDIMRHYKLRVFDDDSKPYNLNILNIRSLNRQAGKFDDLQIVFWKYRGVWTAEYFDVTTDPGVPHLLKPLNKKGTAIVVPGQYRGVWAIGKHRGKYEALVQVKPILVARDWDKDEVLDVPTYSYVKKYNIYEDISAGHGVHYGIEYKLDHGLFGINCHRASSYGLRETVGLYSAGCCVHNNLSEYLRFISLCVEGAKHWGNSFTATWLDERDVLAVVSEDYKDI